MRFLLLVLTVSLSGQGYSADQSKLTPAMTSAIQHISAGAAPLTEASIDAKNCGNIPPTPGFVVADFDGDGRKDFAVLLKTEKPGRMVEWEGRKVPLANYVFAILVDNGKGGFTAKLIERFEDNCPLAAFLEPQAPGAIRDRDTGKEVTIQNPSVTLLFCDKSAAVYHFVGKRIHTVQLGD